MQLYKINFILVMMLIITSKVLSSTLAMNIDVVSASGMGLIYNWNFNVDDDRDNFDFQLLNNGITRFARGNKSFIFSNGASDVDIDYSVRMNMRELLDDVEPGTAKEDYIPLIFRVSSSENNVVNKCTEWFTPEEFYNGEAEDAIKIIDDGRFRKAANESIELDVEWWWNTSYYVGTPSENENYYTIAQVDYEDKLESYNTAVDNANSYLDEHSYGTITDPEGNTTEGFDCTCGASHEEEYQNLLDIVDSREAMVDNHIKLKYDSYDNKALDYLQDNLIDIVFYVTGDQVAPGI